MSTVHPTSQIGFGKGTNELYNKARGEYEPEVLSQLRAAIQPLEPLNVVESVVCIWWYWTHRQICRIGAGTGLFARALLAHEEWKSVRNFRAVDPSEGMRETFAKYTKDDRVVLSEGTFAETSVDNGWADRVVIAQAFHWCLDHEEAATEFARILRPGGVLALTWVQRDKENTPWLDQYLKRVDRDDKGAPTSRTGLWRQLFNTPAYTKAFAPPEETGFTYSTPDTRDGLVSRALSGSRIVVLSDVEKEVFVKDVEAIIQRGDGKVWIDEEKGIFEHPQRVIIAVSKRV
ncbi:S-adenosyl-L-methionine-dependent methyltransferase [Mycena sanguinolenta]|nr:S-adenosyl-L-methionine-dependent methyltransferase [Mycena sanguinolenta]